jgi:hypothetical protein
LELLRLGRSYSHLWRFDIEKRCRQASQESHQAHQGTCGCWFDCWFLRLRAPSTWGTYLLTFWLLVVEFHVPFPCLL